MIKTLATIIVIFLLVFAAGCKSRKAVAYSQKTKQQGNVQQYQQSQSEKTIIEKIAANSNKRAIVKTETNQPIVQNEPAADTNNLKKPPTEPNNILTTEPNVAAKIPEPNIVAKIPGPNEPNERADICELVFYKKFQEILNNYVGVSGRVDYKALKRAKTELRAIIDEFARIDPNSYKLWSRDEKISFWINEYNLQMLNIIVSNYPIESSAWSRFFYWPPDDIRYIDKKVGGIEKQKFIIMDEQFSLREIEERILGREFNEPAGFFALYHGGKSGATLSNKPYCGRTLQQQLDYQVKRAISDNQNFRIEPENKTVYLQSYLEPSWYGNYFVSRYDTEKDFKDQPAPIRSVLNFLIKYLPQKDVSYLKLGNYTVSFVRYNWRLDER
jgi:hypothetical protein